MVTFTLNDVWRATIRHILVCGHIIAPRGLQTRELQHQSLQVDMRHSVLTYPERKLNYQFMAAEAHWILTGDDRVSTIAPFNPNISQFSDDGKTFFGAYGPRIASQISYVIETLARDPDSRQAGLTIWRPNPPQTKDVPCTVAIFASIRYQRLHLHVFMRSSDVWLGLPYDIFTFSMLGLYICGELNAVRAYQQLPTYEPGSVFLTAASQHLYERDFENAQKISLQGTAPFSRRCPILVTSGQATLTTLDELRYTKRGDPRRWWEGAEDDSTNI